MDKIWANRIIAGTKSLDDIANPERRTAVEAELKRRFDAGIITEEQYNKAMGIVDETEEVPVPVDEDNNEEENN